MATALKSAPCSTVAAVPSAAPTSQPSTNSKGLATDWAALVIWTVCFAFMALLHLKDLLVSLFH
jgi:hypothetical protein